MAESLADFFDERLDFLQFKVVPGSNGGYDVVLRIDGTYTSKDDAEDLRQYWIRIFSAVLHNHQTTAQN